MKKILSLVILSTIATSLPIKAEWDTEAEEFANKMPVCANGESNKCEEFKAFLKEQCSTIQNEMYQKKLILAKQAQISEAKLNNYTEAATRLLIAELPELSTDALNKRKEFYLEGKSTLEEQLTEAKIGAETFFDTDLFVKQMISTKLVALQTELILDEIEKEIQKRTVPAENTK